MPQVKDRIAVVGFSLLDQYGSSNAAFMIVGLKPFVDRRAAMDSAQASIGRAPQRLHPVFTGMLMASTIGILVVPMLYALFQGLSERGVRRRRARAGGAACRP